MTDTPKLLDDLLRVPAPSGYEAPASEVWRDAASSSRRSAPTASARRSRSSATPMPQPLLAIAGHMDEIGLVVTHIDDKGFIWFGSIGGWDPQILVGQRVEIVTKDGPIAGVAGRKPIHLLEEEQRKKVVELKQLHIDIGAEDGDAARELVRLGDPAVIAGEPMPRTGLAPRLALDGQPPRLLRGARGRAALRRVGQARLPGRGRGQRPGGDRPLRRPHGRVRPRAHARDRGRRDARH